MPDTDVERIASKQDMGVSGEPERFILKAWDVVVAGYGESQIIASSRGKALSSAWQSDAFSHLSFKEFLGIAKARKSIAPPHGFGAPITVDGEPAFFVDKNRAYVRIARPNGSNVLSAHPYDVLPENYRPARYQSAVRKHLQEQSK